MSIAPYEQVNGTAQVAAVQPPAMVSAVAQLTEWAQGAQAAYQVAENLVNTSFCPQHYRGKPHEATAAILAGLEVGLQPMASLQAFVPIQGSAAPKAMTLRAIVQSKGHALDLVESSSTRAVVVGRRNGTGTPQRSEWTIERAEQMKLTSRDQWKLQPTAMLVARATAECARLVASDALLGIPHAIEELEDGAGPVLAVAEQTTPPAAPVVERRRNRASVLPAAAAAVDEPAAQSGPVESTRLDPKGEVIAQLRDALDAGGHMAAGTALAFLSEVAGREVRHPKELTHAEAREVLGRLAESAAETSGDEK